MICAANGFVGNALLVEKSAKLGLDAGIVAIPKGAKGVVSGLGALVRICRFTRWIGRRREFRDQGHFTISANGKPLAIFGFALGTDHGVMEFTIQGGAPRRCSRRT